MSYILDALRRADQERNLGEVPKLDMALQPALAGERRSRWTTVLLIFCVAALVASTGWLIQLGVFGDLIGGSSDTDAAPPLAVITAAPVAQPQSQSTSQPAQQPDSQSAAKPAQPAAQAQPQQQFESQSKQDIRQDTQADMQPAQSQTSTSEPPSSAATAGEVTTAAAQPQPVFTPPPPSSPADSGYQNRSPRLPTPTVAPAPPPNWARDEATAVRRSQVPREGLVSYLGLPKATRDSMPALNMNAHVFSTNPARSFVLINSKRYRSGDNLAEGPQLVDILPDGAVLEHRGTEFLLPVQR